MERHAPEESDLVPDLEEASRFLDTLIGGPSFDAMFVFQTFDDRPSKDKSLARVVPGTLREAAAGLTRLNCSGAGVYVTVQETDGTGRRRAENIVGLRALFVDSDDGDLPDLKLPPDILVQSKNGQHAYWLLRPGESLEQFKAAQKALAIALGTDASVCDLPRVMRVPGFYHQKDPFAPYLVRLLVPRSEDAHA